MLKSPPYDSAPVVGLLTYQIISVVSDQFFLFTLVPETQIVTLLAKNRYSVDKFM